MYEYFHSTTFHTTLELVDRIITEIDNEESPFNMYIDSSRPRHYYRQIH